jgi:type II secretory pathway component PulJ
MLVVATGLVQAANDKEQIKPMLAEIAAMPATLGQVEHLLADTGYCSKGNLAACEEARIEPFIAVAREDHHPGWRERFQRTRATGSRPPLERMAYKLKTQSGRKRYALRKQTVEPVFGIIVGHGVSLVPLRGLEKAKASGPWSAWRGI